MGLTSPYKCTVCYMRTTPTIKFYFVNYHTITATTITKKTCVFLLLFFSICFDSCIRKTHNVMRCLCLFFVCALKGESFIFHSKWESLILRVKFQAMFFFLFLFLYQIFYSTWGTSTKCSNNTIQSFTNKQHLRTPVCGIYFFIIILIFLNIFF